MDSPGFKALSKATEIVKGESKPYSICGSLPLVGDLQVQAWPSHVLVGHGHCHLMPVSSVMIGRWF